jgi:hypothetical protein
MYNDVEHIKNNVDENIMYFIAQWIRALWF